MSRSDYAVLLIISEINAVFVLILFFTLRMEIPVTYEALYDAQWGMFVLSPVATFLFLWLFSRWSSLVQFGKFCLISFSNLVIDFGILNLFIYYFGVAEGLFYSVFKTVSFILANINSYHWNKSWTFGGKAVSRQANQFVRFSAVVGVGLVIHVATASAVVAKFGGSELFSPTVWANIGAAVSLVVTLFWNFFGMKYLVFSKKS